MTGDTEDVGVRLGEAIRAQRHVLGLTLVDVAARAGLSHPFLSQLERGLARPSMRSLTAIASTLGTSAQALMAAAELPAGPAAQLPHDPAAQPPHDPAAQPPHDPAAQRLPAGPAAQPPHDPAAQRLPAGPAGEPVSVVRHGPGARPPVDSPGGTVRTLVRGERAMLPVEYTGAPSVFDEYICHDGEEFVYVVGGVIEVDIEGELHVAAAGDSVYYAGGLRHRWRSIGDTEVQLVVVQQNLRSRGRRELAPPKHGADAHVT